MPDPSAHPEPPPRDRTIVAAGMLLAALALVALYTSRGSFTSPLALVVIAAIGAAALLLQFRLRSNLSTSGRTRGSAPFWLNAFGVIFAIAAVFGDLLRLNQTVALIVALAAVACFAVGGVLILSSLRRLRS